MPANPRGRRQRSARRTTRVQQAHPRPTEAGPAEAGPAEAGAAEADATEARAVEVQAVARADQTRRRGARRGARAAAAAGQARRAARPERLVAHDAPYVLAELRRIAFVTFGTVGLLIVLVVVDRLQ